MVAADLGIHYLSGADGSWSNELHGAVLEVKSEKSHNGDCPCCEILLYEYEQEGGVELDRHDVEDEEGGALLDAEGEGIEDVGEGAQAA